MMTRLAIPVFAAMLALSCSKSEKSATGDDAAAIPTPVKPADAAPLAKAPADAAAPTPAVTIDAAAAAPDKGSKLDPDATEDGPKNIKVLSKKWSLDRIEKEMRSYTKALGVKCKYCHGRGDKSSDKNPKKAMARKMITMTNSMNRKYFRKAKKKLTCTTCHKGAAEL